MVKNKFLCRLSILETESINFLSSVKIPFNIKSTSIFSFLINLLLRLLN